MYPAPCWALLGHALPTLGLGLHGTEQPSLSCHQLVLSGQLQARCHPLLSPAASLPGCPFLQRTLLRALVPASWRSWSAAPLLGDWPLPPPSPAPQPLTVGLLFSRSVLSPLNEMLSSYDQLLACKTLTLFRPKSVPSWRPRLWSSRAVILPCACLASVSLSWPTPAPFLYPPRSSASYSSGCFCFFPRKVLAPAPRTTLPWEL